MSRIQKLFQFRQSPSQLGIAVIAAAVFSCGLWWHHAGLLGGGAVGLCVAFRSFGEQFEEDRRMAPTGRNRKSVRSRADFATQADNQPADWLA